MILSIINPSLRRLILIRKRQALFSYFLFSLILVNCQGVNGSEVTPDSQSLIRTPTSAPTTIPTSQLLEPITLVPTIIPTRVSTTTIPFPTQFGSLRANICPAQQESVLIVNRLFEKTGYLYSESNGAIINLDLNYRPISWSPSGENLLVTNISKREFGVTDTDGKNLWIIPQPNQEHVCKSAWLSETELLVSGCTNLGFPLYDDDKTYIFDLTNQKYVKIGQDVIRRVESISPNGNIWFENGGDHLYMVSKNGNEKIVDFLPISIDNMFPLELPALVFSPDGNMVYFMKAEVKQTDSFYVLYGTQIVDDDLLSEELIFKGVLGSDYLMKISPNGNFMAIVVSSTDVYIVNLKTKEVDYHWNWPDPRRGPPNFTWSPDSLSLGLTTLEGHGQVFIMDIVTGQISTLFSDVVTVEVVDWRCVPVNK